MFPSIEIFGREIGTYGILVVIGGFFCALVGRLLVKRFGMDLFDFLILMLSIGVGIFIGAHIVFALTNIKTLVLTFQHIGELWFERFWDLFVSCIGGMVFYGGFLGGLAAIPVYRKFDKRCTCGQLFDVYAVLVPLFHVFGRIGCFLGGCCYGIESPFGFTVHGNEMNPGINDVCRLPVQLIESVCNLLIFLLIFYLFQKRIMEKRLIFLYMLIYPVVRFTLEFFRGDEIRGFVFGLSTSQWISIFLFAAAVIGLTVAHFRKNKQTAAV